MHEWGHGTVAWLYGYKASPFQVEYGGWLLLHVDENVPYNEILAAHHGFIAAMISIAGLTVSIVLFSIAMLLFRKTRHPLFASLLHWKIIINMIPIIQYLVVQPFSEEGDTGRFVHGLGISPWWILAPGVIFVGFALFQICSREVPHMYAVIPISGLFARRIFLLATLSVLFLLIYSHGYNPLSDQGMPWIGRFFAGLTLLLVPILLFVCDPSREWVKSKIELEAP